VLDQATMDVEVWGRKYDAQKLIQQIRFALMAAKQDPTNDISHVDTYSAPQYFPDPVTEEDRWIMTVALYIRARS